MLPEASAPMTTHEIASGAAAADSELSPPRSYDESSARSAEEHCCCRRSGRYPSCLVTALTSQMGALTGAYKYLRCCIYCSVPPSAPLILMSYSPYLYIFSRAFLFVHSLFCRA